MSKLKTLVDQVREARAQLADYTAVAKSELEDYRENHKAVFDQLDALVDAQEEKRGLLVADVGMAETALREAAVEEYLATQNKAPAPGVGIRVTTSYDYYPAEAFNWAVEHKQCLALDTKAFKDVCKADALRPDFVTVVQTPTATIATDLSEVAK